MNKEHIILGLLRLAIGWKFLWAFLDKTFGLGFATESSKAWIAGGSPTQGFLSNATTGFFAEFYQSIAGHPVVDVMFMLGLFLVGISLMLGVMTRLASLGGALMMILMYTAVLPPANNPIVDDHIIYILVLFILAVSSSGNYFGLGKKWKQSRFVQKHRFFA